MAVRIPLNLSQPDNKLSQIAEAERKAQLPINDYSTKNEYSSVNKDALANGDEKGKGTGGDLDIFNESAGSSTDVFERKIELAKNPFNNKNPYTTPSA